MRREEGGPCGSAAREAPGGDAARARRAAPRSGFGRGFRWSLALAFVLFPAPVFALLISLSFESVAGSVPLTGAGTNTAMLNFGSVSAFEPLKTGVSRTVGASSYTISTRFGVRTTHLLGLLSPSYTLQARLQTANALAWQVDGRSMSTSPVTIATSQPYGSVVPHTLAFVVPFTQPAGAVTTVFEITAIAN
jgi:hypothetical protein